VHIPYDNAPHGSAEDNYNFFHSSSRIIVECTFGEIDLHFRIFWQPLKYSLKFNCSVIDSCFRLHNFIVKHQEGETTTLDECDFKVFDEECHCFYAICLDLHEGVDNGEMDTHLDQNRNPDHGGQPRRSKARSTELGIQCWNIYQDEIDRQGLICPQSNWYWSRNRVLILNF
jgi:hypothetical protein